MSFPSIQAGYAAHNVVTYPLSATKIPAVKGYHLIGAEGSAQLAKKFVGATAGGFLAGRRNGLTVVDIDSPDAKLIDECVARFGATPLHVVTPSGGRHLYYRHNGEGRRIRAFPNVDILGTGNVVCAGSETAKGRYQIERGSLDHLNRLPPVRASADPPVKGAKVPVGSRGTELFKYCQSIVNHCDDYEALVDAARTWAEPRMEQRIDDVFTDAQVLKTVNSVWTYRGGRKRFMQHVIEGPKFAALMADPEVWTLCSYLMIENGPAAEFWIADGLGKARGWPRRMVPNCRKILLDMGPH
jgi:hypothetical protein